MASVASQLIETVTVSRMRERYAQTVLTFRMIYVKTDNCASLLGTLVFPADVYLEHLYFPPMFTWNTCISS